jgi:hypothetical protein
MTTATAMPRPPATMKAMRQWNRVASPTMMTGARAKPAAPLKVWVAKARPMRCSDTVPDRIE